MEEKKLMDVGFIQCPFCKHLSESFVLKADDILECYSCKLSFKKDEAVIKVLKKPYVTCLACGHDVSLTPGNLAYTKEKNYICPVCRKSVNVE